MVPLAILSLSVQAASVDLNNFFADPTVTVAVDGSSALLKEDPGFAEVLLADDPGLGDPEVIVAAPGTGLFFDYVFEEAGGEDDRVFAYLLEGATGNSLGPAFEFFTDTTSSGTVALDLSSLTGTQLGLSFALQSGPADSGYNSTLTISNVRLDALTTVPLPAAIVNMLVGLVILVTASQRLRQRLGAA